MPRGVGELVAAAEKRGLLAAYRPYLLLLANEDLDADIRPKVSPSDVVQSVLTLGYDRSAGGHDATPI